MRFTQKKDASEILHPAIRFYNEGMRLLNDANKRISVHVQAKTKELAKKKFELALKEAQDQPERLTDNLAAYINKMSREAIEHIDDGHKEFTGKMIDGKLLKELASAENKKSCCIL